MSCIICVVKQKQEEIATAFIEEMEDLTTHKEIVLDGFADTPSYTGVFGEKVGCDRVVTLYTFFNDIFPSLKTNVINVSPHKNITTINFKATCFHGGELIEPHVQQVLEGDVSENLKLMATTHPTGEELDFFVGATFVYEEEKIALLNIASDMSQMEEAFLPHADPKDLEINLSAETNLIKNIQRLIEKKLSTMEIKILSFILCGFSSKHTAEYLLLSLRTIEGYIQNAYGKLGCFSKEDLLEKMYQNRSIAIFQQLCQFFIINFVKNEVRNIFFSVIIMSESMINFK